MLSPVNRDKTVEYGVQCLKFFCQGISARAVAVHFPA
jgi:hypothetical protein